MRRATRSTCRIVSFRFQFQSTLSMRRATNRSMDIVDTTLFQSTLSMRRATIVDTGLRKLAVISIHALHEESDSMHSSRDRFVPISIHALHEESDWLRYGYYVQRFIFQSTLSMRRATVAVCFSPPHSSIFQSTLSMRRATNLR